MGKSRVIFFGASSDTTLEKSAETKAQMILGLDSPDFKSLIRTKRIIGLSGRLLRDQTSIRKHAGKIREYFKLAEPISSEVRHFINVTRKQADIVVGVYLHQRDYSQFMGGKYYYSIEQYRMIFGQVESLFPSKQIVYVICTDVQNLPEQLDGIQVYLTQEHPVKDLYSLAACDFLVGPPSMCASWASFYGQVPSYKIMDLSQSPTLDEFVINRG